MRNAETEQDNHVHIEVKWRKKRRWVLLALLGLCLALVLSQPTFESNWTVWQMPLAGQVIVVDAGHGGDDPGAVSQSGILEKDVALNIASELRDYLQQSGAYVVMTRETDTDLADKGTQGYRKRKVEDLQARVQLIKETEPNFVISIHLNSIGSSRWFGAQTFYHPAFGESKRLAHLIQHRIIQDVGNTTRVAKADSEIFLLKSAHVPAVMVEVGFLSNLREAELLGQEPYQDRLATSIYKGVLAYFAGETPPSTSDR